jgi:YVTN family beta-propeller protein
MSPLRKITSKSHNATKALIFNSFNCRWLKPTVIEIHHFRGFSHIKQLFGEDSKLILKMRNMRTILNLSAIIAASLVLVMASCKKDDKDEIQGAYSRGVLISNEGPFIEGSGSISFYDPTTKTIENNIFQTINNRPLGNIVQSIEVFTDRAYIVVNNAAKVEVAEAGTFESVGVIEGLVSPRYFMGISQTKAYVSDWAGHVAIIDLNSLAKTGTIATGASPDRMLLDGTRLWVINSAGWSSDSTLTIIDTQTDTALKTIVVGDNPSGIVKDASGKIWVICGGKFDWANPENNTPGKLVRINPETFNIELSSDLGETYFDARLAINATGDKLYFTLSGGLFSVDLNTKTGMVSKTVLNRPFYALGIDPQTGEIYVSDPLDYAQPGFVFRYDPENFAVVDSVKAGIIPGNFSFVY